MHSGLVNPIDFALDGRQAGHLAIPYSVDRSPYYQIRIPILRLKNGAGPSLLLMAGNHGDEYEGELQLGRLMRPCCRARRSAAAPYVIASTASFTQSRRFAGMSP